MNYMNKHTQEMELLCSVTEGQWGTIGPHFLNANEVLAKHAGTAHALVVFSASAALETILRAKNIGYGDEVIVAAWSDPVDAMTVAAVGATPVFADVCKETYTLTPDTITPHLTERTRAVIADLTDGVPFDVSALSAICKEKQMYFILNLGDAFGTKQNNVPVQQLADASFVNMSEGCALNLGLAGAIFTNSEEDFNLFYAYHNCGRPMGDGATLAFDQIIGGDLRIAEWQASMIPGRLLQLEKLLADHTDDKGVSSGSVRAFMAAASFWNDPYFTKLTGGTAPADPAKAYPVSAEAAEISR